MLSPLARDHSVLQHHFPRGTARRVLAQARPFKGWFIVFAVAVLGGSATTVIPMLLFQRIIDDGVLAGNTGLVVQLALVVAGLALVGMGLGLLERWCSARIGEGLTHRLRCQLFDRVNSMPLAFFTRSSTGRLVSRIVGDVAGAQQAFTSTFSQALSNATTLLLVLGSMLLLSWQLTLAALVLLPVFLVPAKLVARRTARLARLRMDHQAQLTEIMTERFTVSGAMLVKLFGNPRRESRMFEAQAGQLARDGVQMAMTVRIFLSTLTLAGALATAVFYGLGGNAVIGGQLSLGTLTAMVALLARLYGPLTQLSNLRIDLMTAMVSFERVFEVLDLKPSIYDAHDSINVPGPPSIEFDKVWFTYPTASEVSLPSLTSEAEREQKRGGKVLSEISFYVEPGQTVALVGPSGAGKTTFVDILLGLLKPVRGSIKVDGVDIQQDIRAWQANLAYVPQTIYLIDGTIRENIALGMRPENIDDEKVVRVLKMAELHEFVSAQPAGANTMVGERGVRLSGGQRQRIGIARALYQEPEVLILDEATSALDNETEESITHTILKLKGQITILSIAHRVSTLAECDFKVKFAEGRAELLEKA